MKMKRLLLLLIVVTLAISIFSGCAGNNVPDEPKQGDSAVLSNKTFTIKVPEEWPDKIYAEITEDEIKIYQKAAYEAFGGGWLGTIRMYDDDSVYPMLPAYEVIAYRNEKHFVAEYPSDVQADVENQESMDEYFEMFALLPDVFKETFDITAEE